MFKEIEINSKTYFIRSAIKGDKVQCFLSDFASNETHWSETITKDILLKRSKELNPRIRYDEEMACNTLTKMEPSEASFDEEILKLKYKVENVPFKIDWHLKRLEPDEFREHVVQPLFSTIFGLNQQVEELKEVIRKKDLEIQQYKIEGSVLKRTTVQTQAFNFPQYEEKYSKVSENAKCFSKVASFFKDPEVIVGSQEYKDKKKGNVKSEDAQSPTKSFGVMETTSPRNRKRKAKEAQNLHLINKLNARQKTLAYESSQSQSFSEDTDGEQKAKRFKSNEKKSPTLPAIREKSPPTSSTKFNQRKRKESSSDEDGISPRKTRNSLAKVNDTVTQKSSKSNQKKSQEKTSKEDDPSSPKKAVNLPAVEKKSQEKASNEDVGSSPSKAKTKDNSKQKSSEEDEEPKVKESTARRSRFPAVDYLEKTASSDEDKSNDDGKSPRKTRNSLAKASEPEAQNPNKNQDKSSKEEIAESKAGSSSSIQKKSQNKSGNSLENSKQKSSKENSKEETSSSEDQEPKAKGSSPRKSRSATVQYLEESSSSEEGNSKEAPTKSTDTRKLESPQKKSSKLQTDSEDEEAKSSKTFRKTTRNSVALTNESQALNKSLEVSSSSEAETSKASENSPRRTRNSVGKVLEENSRSLRKTPKEASYENSSSKTSSRKSLFTEGRNFQKSDEKKYENPNFVIDLVTQEFSQDSSQKPGSSSSLGNFKNPSSVKASSSKEAEIGNIETPERSLKSKKDLLENFEASSGSSPRRRGRPAKKSRKSNRKAPSEELLSLDSFSRMEFTPSPACHDRVEAVETISESDSSKTSSQTLESFGDMSAKLDSILKELQRLEEQRLADLAKRKLLEE